jgi:hypothetical protein
MTPKSSINGIDIRDFVKRLRTLRRKLNARIRQFDEFDILAIERYTYKVELLNCLIAQFGGFHYTSKR